MSDHTPGPWVVDGPTTNSESYECYYVRTRDGIIVAEIDGWGSSGGMKNDARLIAETPVMHKVCKEIVECIRDCDSCEATGIEMGTTADACYICGGVGQVLGGDDIFAALDARDLLKRLGANDG